MRGQLAGRVLVCGCLAAIWAVACEGDPPKRSAFDGDAGSGGEAVGSGGSSAPGNEAGSPSGDAGSPGSSGGMPGSDGGMPGSDGGTPGTNDGGMPGDAGAPNQPTAGAPSSGACEGPLTFADVYVEEQVMQALNLQSGPVTSDMVQNLTHLVIPFNDDEIDLHGIECLTSLVSLDVSGGGGITPISQLALLPNLRTIDHSDGYLSDLVGFEALTQLTSLNVSRNNIYDFSPLATLVDLVQLDISENYNFYAQPVNNASLASLTKLESLDVNNVAITDFSFLASLPNLVALDLGSTGLTAIPDLSEMDDLDVLGLSGNTLASFTPLEGLTGLSRLDLRYTGLSSLTSIAPLTGLTHLNVAGNALTNITVLGALPLLSVLDISENSAIASLQPLVDSSYIGSGDTIAYSLYDCATFGAAVDTLIARGVVMEDYCQ